MNSKIIANGILRAIAINAGIALLLVFLNKIQILDLDIKSRESIAGPI